jgi:hypothetical protein
VRAEEIVAGTLVHHRHGVEVRDRRRVECLLHQPAVVEEGRAVQPLRGARQRCGAGLGIEGLRLAATTVVQDIREAPQGRFAFVPMLQGMDQTGCDRASLHGTLQVVRDDEQAPIQAAIAQGGQFHGNSFESGLSAA